MDPSQLKADLKAFERDFKAKHSRDPTYDEIKQIPAIAEKYKLYKKLSKQSSSSRPPANSTVAALSFKSRAVITESPAQTNNPFSPAKAKRVHNDPPVPSTSTAAASSSSNLLFPQLQLSASRGNVNPFTTPTKSKSKPKTRPVPTLKPLEEDPFPPLVPSTQPSTQHDLPKSNNLDGIGTHREGAAERAVSRARKRLRGDPVSPSPVKEKRIRVHSVNPASSSTSHTVPKFVGGKSARGDTDNEGQDEDEDTSFLDDSPMKPLTGARNGKTFTTLFDDAAPSTVPLAKRPSLAQIPPKSSLGLLGRGPFARKAQSRALSPDDEDIDMDIDMPSDHSSNKIKALNLDMASNPSGSKSSSSQKLLKAGSSTRRLPRTASIMPSIGGLARSNSTKAALVPPTSLKRLSSDTEPDLAPSSSNSNRVSTAPETKLGYLPPSPPPAGSVPSSKWANNKGKGRALSNVGAGRKKAKLAEADGKGKGKSVDVDMDTEEEGDLQDDGVNVKEVDWRARTRVRSSQKLDDTTDAILDEEEEDWSLAAFRPAPVSTSLDHNQLQDGTVEVNLPDDLKRVLAFSPNEAKRRELAERKMAKELIYGSREMHFDSRKGAEIWDVGEDVADGARSADERVYEGYGEDDGDWEGEPVPWELAEL